MNREELVVVAERRSRRARKAMRHTHIECFCDDRRHRRDNYDHGCFCPPCARKAAVKLGYPATDIEPEHEGPDDSPQFCQTCDRLITLRTTPSLEWGITPDGAQEELKHWEKTRPTAPGDWLCVLLMLDSLAEEFLPRAEAVIVRANRVAA